MWKVAELIFIEDLSEAQIQAVSVVPACRDSDPFV
jgi:hypothetical protein